LGTVDRRKAEHLRDEKDRALAEQKARLLLGLPIAIDVKPITLSQFRDQYLAYHEKSRDKSAATVYGERSHLAVLIEFFGVNKLLGALSQECLRAYKIHRMTRGHRRPDGSRVPISAYTWNSHFASLKSVFTTAEGWCLVARNPFAGLSRVPQPPLPSKAINGEQLTNVLKKTRERFWQLIILLLYGLDCRRGELCRLRRLDVHRKQGFLEILKTKEGRRKVTPITPDLLAIIDELEAISKSEYVCSLNGGPLRGDQVTKAIRAIGRDAGVPLSPHRLRHTSSTDLLERGASLATVMKIAGHSQIATTQGYMHPDLKAQRRAMRRLPLGKLSQVPTATLQRRPASHRKTKG
jgi:integrase